MVSDEIQPFYDSGNKRRLLFNDQYEKTMRTVVVQIHDANIYRGKKEDELKHFLLVFRNHVCYKYFKMPEERANWYIASIDRKDEGFR